MGKLVKLNELLTELQELQFIIDTELPLRMQGILNRLEDGTDNEIDNEAKNNNTDYPLDVVRRIIANHLSLLSDKIELKIRTKEVQVLFELNGNPVKLELSLPEYNDVLGLNLSIQAQLLEKLAYECFDLDAGTTYADHFNPVSLIKNPIDPLFVDSLGDTLNVSNMSAQITEAQLQLATFTKDFAHTAKDLIYEVAIKQKIALRSYVLATFARAVNERLITRMGADIDSKSEMFQPTIYPEGEYLRLNYPIEVEPVKLTLAAIFDLELRDRIVTIMHRRLISILAAKLAINNPE